MIFLVEVLSRMVLFGFFIFLYLWIERGQTIKRLRGINERLENENYRLHTHGVEVSRLVDQLTEKINEKKGTGRKPTRRKRK